MNSKPSIERHSTSATVCPLSNLSGVGAFRLEQDMLRERGGGERGEEVRGWCAWRNPIARTRGNRKRTVLGFASSFVFVVLLPVLPRAFAAEGDIELPVTGEPLTAPTITVVHLISNASAVVQFVMALLALFSIVSWGIIFAKIRHFLRAKRESLTFDNVFWSSKNLAQITEASRKLNWSPVASVYLAGHEELHRIVRSNEGRQESSDFNDLENIDRALKKAKMKQVNILERGTTFLATTASAAPFIGLFGTVWGIMNAFLGLSHAKNTSIQAVAPGISEALIATAIGLAAAIPAAIAYNYFMQEVRVLTRAMDTFSAEFLNIARRHFLK